MVVHGGGRLAGGVEVDSRGDHRVAMALSILALCAAAPVRVRDVACVGTSYPSFWDDLDRLAAGRSGS
jgi:3-phosphoshikimate 1-carboxyvinyltransferase